MDKRKRKPIAVDISNWGGRSIVYECPNCHTSFRLMEDKERFCHNCGIKIDWNVQLLLDKPFVEADNFLLLKQILSEVNKKNEGDNQNEV